MHARALTPAVGVEVVGVDLASAADEVVDAVRAEVERHGCVVLRDQRVEPGRHLELARRMGDVQDTPTHPRLRAHPGVTALANRPEAGFTDVGGFWHADGIFLRSPSRYSLVSVRAVPPGGASTVLVDMADLYASLSPHQRVGLSSTWVRYRASAVHPLVIGLPGRAPAVYCSPALATAVHGPDPCAADLLRELDACLEERGREGRVALAADDLLVWDNLRVAHRAGDDTDDGLRLLHRVTTEAPAPPPLLTGPRPSPSGPGWTPVRRRSTPPA